MSFIGDLAEFRDNAVYMVATGGMGSARIKAAIVWHTYPAGTPVVWEVDEHDYLYGHIIKTYVLQDIDIIIAQFEVEL